MSRAAGRRSGDDRRAQLVEIGLELLPSTPIQDLTIDEVARRAGISRSLLFHYFATKRDYYTAVTTAAAELLLAHVLPAAHPGAEPLAGMLDRFVGWVEVYRDSYVAFVSGAGGGDPWVADVYQDTREQLVDAVLDALDRTPDMTPDIATRQLVRAWFAFTEDLVLSWVHEPTMPRADLVELIAGVRDRLLLS